MEQRNYLNFDGTFLDKPVYRYMKLDRFFKLFDDRQNALSHPRKWDDPFENFILNAKIRGSDGKLRDFGFRDQVYGQCWTVERRSDALWQIFCGKAQGLRIRTTLRKLGATGRSIFMDRFDPETIARSLLRKRTAFRHEAEVRLVYPMTSGEPAKDGLFRYPIDPHALIDQVMIDPRFRPAEASELKRKIRDRTGYKGNLLSSLLYSRPKGFAIVTMVSSR